jgi:hypothetical protein
VSPDWHAKCCYNAQVAYIPVHPAESNIIELDILARMLATMLARGAPLVRSGGRQRIRLALTLMLGCSHEIADQLITTLILRKQLVVSTDAAGREVWRAAELNS